MPNKKSAKKELRKSVKREAANLKVKNVMKTAIKKSLKKVQATDKSVKEDLAVVMKNIDKAAKKGVIKKRTAARKKSRLAKKINKLK
ncbi:MAG TPA: 30S ribosomal protein S20 [bacterium]|jgi:small subunit ribosomal protein S20|nr:MAG: 30S ribosomal protein S20 [Parcubacteria group bacterium ADurb.Bin115]HNU81606.1 30S ribosomal protein S20 [bacterium]HPW05914.1 30S ribosomal protein S20 [bacterium]HPY99248.1 30S ribosomal protein S20 [bacterium]HQB76434.1 30S ribosomal protein S20 [bacterium]